MAKTTLVEYESDLDERISASKVSGFWSKTFKDNAINTGGRQVCNAHRWGFLELALKTQTQNQQEYYDYPTTIPFTEDSIYQINIAGEQYGDTDGRERASWGELQRAKNSGDTESLLFANHNGFYFLFPIPADGKEMDLYGLKKWTTLIDTSDISTVPTELDDAVIKIALAQCLRKQGKYNEARAEMLDVLDPQVGIISSIWSKMNEENHAGYKGQTTSSRWER